jgi:hypothetical protein
VQSGYARVVRGYEYPDICKLCRLERTSYHPRIYEKFLMPNKKAEGKGKTWEDGVASDVEAMEERSWKNLAESRSVW